MLKKITVQRGTANNAVFLETKPRTEQPENQTLKSHWMY